MATCSTCGYAKTPVGKRSCYNCGRPLQDDGRTPASSLPPAPTAGAPGAPWSQSQYETREFVVRWSANPGEGPYVERTKDETATAAHRLALWHQTQAEILPKLQALRDEGWEPVTEVGPGAFTVHEFHYFNIYGKILIVVLLCTILLALLGLILWDSGGLFGVQATEFRVQLRRRIGARPPTQTHAADQPNSTIGVGPADVAGQMERLAALHAAGSISDVEYDAAKKKVLA